VEILLEICLGIGLSAACGLRVFVPLLVLSVASRSGHLDLAPGFAWIGGSSALVTFAVATLVEVAAYYVPWLDHLLDAVASPAAVIAGVVVTASVVTSLDPYLRWTLAIIAGGGAAGAVQSLTAGTRLLSTFSTGGLGNPILSSLELAGAMALAILAVLLPVAAGLATVILLVLVARKLLKRRAPAGAA
jgi:hypothetical protein